MTQLTESKSTRYPVHDEVDVKDDVPIYEQDKWWRAVLHIEDHGGEAVAVYLWKRKDGEWKRIQKYRVRAKEDWERDRVAIESLLSQMCKG